MKRLAERIQAASLRLMQEAELPIQPSNVLILASLHHDGPQANGSLAKELQIAQPTVTRAVLDLIRYGLTEISHEHIDQRFKTIALTDRGREVWISAAVKVFGPLEAAVNNLLEDLSGPLLPLLETVEQRLT
jgi:DNA-binding MarR family transcriptional regulator